MARQRKVADVLYARARNTCITGAGSTGAALLAAVAPFPLLSRFPDEFPSIKVAAGLLLLLSLFLGLTSKMCRRDIRCPECEAPLWPLFFRKYRLWCAPASADRCSACRLDLTEPWDA